MEPERWLRGKRIAGLLLPEATGYTVRMNFCTLSSDLPTHVITHMPSSSTHAKQRNIKDEVRKRKYEMSE